MQSRRRRLAVAAFASALTALLGGAFLTPDPGSPARALSVAALSISAVLALCAVGGAALSARPFVERLGLAPSRLDARSTLLLVAGFLGLSQALQSAIALSGLRAASALPALDDAIASARGGERLLVVVALGLVPGIAEELFCRGWLQRGLAHRASPRAAIVGAAAVFGVMHLDPVHALAAFGLGLYLGWVGFVSDGVRAPGACHVANNLVAVGATVLGVTPSGVGFAAVTGAGGALLAALALRTVHRRIRAAAGGQNGRNARNGQNGQNGPGAPEPPASL